MTPQGRNLPDQALNECPIIKEKTISQLSTLPAPPPAWLPPDEWPLPSRLLHVGDDTIHYIDVGKGPTILFVEFFTGRSAYLCDPEGNYYEITWAEPNNPITSRRTTRA